MKKEYMEYICGLHGYMIRIKEIHWNTENNALHLLCDDIEDDLCELEDRFAECAMGIEGKKVKIGQLMPMLPNAENIMPMLKELEDETIAMKKKMDDYKEGGLINILDEILEICNKYKYRSTQK